MDDESALVVVEGVAALRELADDVEGIEARGFSDADVARLADHPRIRELHLPACGLLTVLGLAALVTMPALEVLAFCATPQVDDGWLDVLASSTRPRKLILIGCPGVTEEGVRRLAERRPELEVEVPGAGS